MLDELHPVEDTPLCIAFPWLGVFTKCGIPDYPKYRNRPDEGALGDQTQEPLLQDDKAEKKKKKKKKKKNAIKNKAVFEAEPLAQLGVGIVTYVHILWVLFASFLLFTLLLLPTMNHYEGGTGYMGSNPKLIQYETGMIGNMGYSSTQCVSVPMDLGKINIQCPYGDVGVISHYGVNLSDDTANNCVENDDIASCKPDA